MLTFLTVNGEGTPHIHNYEENYFDNKNIVILCDYCPLCDAVCEEMDYLGDKDPVLIGAYVLDNKKAPINVELLREDQQAPVEVVEKIRAWFFNDRDESSYEDQKKKAESFDDDDFDYEGDSSYEDDNDSDFDDEEEYDEDW